jgi:hypothetical protein
MASTISIVCVGMRIERGDGDHRQPGAIFAAEDKAAVTLRFENGAPGNLTPRMPRAPWAWERLAKRKVSPSARIVI